MAPYEMSPGRTDVKPDVWSLSIYHYNGFLGMWNVIDVMKIGGLTQAISFGMYL